MNHGAPRQAGDYPCHCQRCEPLDPERDWFVEAVQIYFGTTRLLAQREHVVAIIDRFRTQAASVANPVTREELRECLDAAERAAMKPSKETLLVLMGIQTEIGAGMVLFPKNEREEAYNLACERAKRIVSAYQDGAGLFQLTAPADMRNGAVAE